MSEPRWVLELLGGDARSAELPAIGSLVVGSSRERAGFVLEGSGVDEAHCAIGRTKEGDWAVKDLGSRNGTLLNGQRVSAARLKLGDQLVLGSQRLELKAPRTAPAVGSARPSDAPQKIGGYRIERLIGKGAMGSVYLAVQESLRRPVALKVLAPRLAADRDFVHRFQAEARAAAALSHPNVVVVYDVGEEAGSHYLSMEFMAGGSLEQKLAASGPLPWKAVLGVLSDAAAGLAYAESRGIVHRDIKPANLMYSGTGAVKIADLGLATTIEEEASVGEGGRKVFGTPHFISPEQARGAPADHRSDLYSLGATAYRLLSGRTSFEGATTRDILRALQTEAPRDLAELVPGTPEELLAVVRRLMQKEPSARFATAESLRRECERLRLVAEHGPALEVEKPPRSRAQLVIGLVLLATVGASAAWYLRRDADGGPRDPGGAPRADPIADAPADPGFFENERPSVPATSDEEGELRAREREASRELAELAPFLTDEERAAALERIRERFPGTAAAGTAASELAALRARAPGSPAALAGALDAADQDMRAALAPLVARGATSAEVLRAIDEFRPPPELGPEFEARRAALDREQVLAAEAALDAALGAADQLALDGKFAELRAELAKLERSLAGLDVLPGDAGRLAGLRERRDALAARVARVDEQERFFHADVERRARRSVGESLGPGSGLLAELGALELEAVERRLAALPADVRARALPSALAQETALARSALAALEREFEGGGWRRKSLLDPRSKKVREVRDIDAQGLLFDKDGALDPLSWREVDSDPDWWNQLFQSRLSRDWSAEETRAIVSLLRLVGAARGARLAREMIDPGARGTLTPGELDALGKVFEPALAWVEGPRADGALREALAREHGGARSLSGALAAAQGSAWTASVTQLERLLAEGEGSLLVGLLRDGRDWRAEPEAAPENGAPPK